MALLQIADTYFIPYIQHFPLVSVRAPLLSNHHLPSHLHIQSIATTFGEANNMGRSPPLSVKIPEPPIRPPGWFNDGYISPLSPSPSPVNRGRGSLKWGLKSPNGEGSSSQPRHLREQPSKDFQVGDAAQFQAAVGGPSHMTHKKAGGEGSSSKAKHLKEQPSKEFRVRDAAQFQAAVGGPSHMTHQRAGVSHEIPTPGSSHGRKKSQARGDRSPYPGHEPRHGNGWQRSSSRRHPRNDGFEEVELARLDRPFQAPEQVPRPQRPAPARQPGRQNGERAYFQGQNPRALEAQSPRRPKPKKGFNNGLTWLVLIFTTIICIGLISGLASYFVNKNKDGNLDSSF